jgi:hypothetical protein
MKSSRDLYNELFTALERLFPFTEHDPENPIAMANTVSRVVDAFGEVIDDLAPILRDIVTATQDSNARANGLAREALKRLGVEDDE